MRRLRFLLTVPLLVVLGGCAVYPAPPAYVAPRPYYAPPPPPPRYYAPRPYYGWGYRPYGYGYRPYGYGWRRW